MGKQLPASLVSLTTNFITNIVMLLPSITAQPITIQYSHMDQHIQAYRQHSVKITEVCYYWYLDPQVGGLRMLIL